MLHECEERPSLTNDEMKKNEKLKKGVSVVFGTRLEMNQAMNKLSTISERTVSERIKNQTFHTSCVTHENEIHSLINCYAFLKLVTTS